MNYVVTFTDKNCINNILKVWLPSLQRNFSGKIVVITFDVDKEDIEKLKNQNVIVIEKNPKFKVLFRLIAQRLIAQKEFINTLLENDKIMLIDGADVVFQDNIDEFFDKINDKIMYSTTGTLTNKTTLVWFDKLIKKYKYTDKCRTIKKKLKNQEIVASGMLAGKKSTFLKFFKKHEAVQNKFRTKSFIGINQIILTYLIINNSKDFEKTDIHNCRLLSNEVIKENGKYKIHKIIPIIHFSCENQKKIYKDFYLTPDSKIIAFPNSISDKPLNILWLYGSVPKFDAINHWYHTGFAKILANKPNVNLLLYGYNMEKLYPDMAKIPFNAELTGKELKKEFNFDIIIMDNKNRFAYSRTLKERRARKVRNFWLKPEFFDGLDNIPKIFLEGDYHLHFKMNLSGEKTWYQDRKVDLLLVRHKTAVDYHIDKTLPIQWFPCSVNDKIFKPNMRIERKNKICLISGYGLNYYSYRTTAGNILKNHGENLIDIYDKRFIGRNYIKNLQSYICHLSGSSVRHITPAKMFEIMASGSVLFTDEGDEYGLKDLFPDDSYVTYNKKDYSDTIEKAQKIINNPDFRKHLTTKALQCIKEKHTHEIRAQELLDIITTRFKISYGHNENEKNVFCKIGEFFFPKHQNIEQQNSEIYLPKETNENSEKINIKNLEKLYDKNIKICLLKDTCYNVVINNEVGNVLYIAVDDEEKAKKIMGESFVFEPFPNETKKFKFEDNVFYIPYPILPYLKKECGDTVVKDLQLKEKSLRLIGDEYRYCLRKRRR